LTATTDAEVRIFLDPTSERATITRTWPTGPPPSREVVGLLDIRKPRGNVFLDRLEDLLNQRGLRTVRFSKPTFAKVAPVDLRQRSPRSATLWWRP